MKRIFLDANVVIDLLGERYPWFPDALRIFNLGDLGKVKLICSSLSLGTASYIMETKKMSSADIFEGIDLLCQICDVAAVDATVVRKSLDSSFTDFEDALQYFSALAVDADVIVTRNEDDFEHSEIPVYNPSQFLALMEGERNK